MNFAPVIAGVSKILGGVPRAYLAIDVETSGLATARDYILQIGHCAVKDGVVVDRKSFYLDWSKANLDIAIVEWLKDRIRVAEFNMAGRGVKKPITWDTLCRCGVDPIEVLSLYRDWFRGLGDLPLVMHNGWGYDVKILGGHFLQFLPEPDLWFGDNSVIDTGALVKAAQTNEVPKPTDTLQSYCTYVCRPGAKGLRWSLHDFAVPHLQLDKKYGFDATAETHDAGHDAWVCAMLFKEMLGA